MKYSFGSKSMDELAGGIETGVLHEIYGETSTGKTTVGGYVPTVSVAKSLGELADNDAFIVIDVDGGWDPDRARQIWVANGLDPELMESKVKYHQPTDFAGQHDYINHLDALIKKNGWNPRLVVCDSMTAIYRGIVLRTDMKHKATTCGLYTGKLDLQLSSLRAIAVNYNCPAVVTNWSLSPLGAAMKKVDDPRPGPEQDFIGGRAFGFLAKVIIRLDASTVNRKKVIRKVTLKKHRSRRAGESCLVEIYDGGLKDV